MTLRDRGGAGARNRKRKLDDADGKNRDGAAGEDEPPARKARLGTSSPAKAATGTKAGRTWPQLEFAPTSDGKLGEGKDPTQRVAARARARAKAIPATDTNPDLDSTWPTAPKGAKAKPKPKKANAKPKTQPKLPFKSEPKPKPKPKSKSKVKAKSKAEPKPKPGNPRAASAPRKRAATAKGKEVDAEAELASVPRPKPKPKPRQRKPTYDPYDGTTRRVMAIDCGSRNLSVAVVSLTGPCGWAIEYLEVVDIIEYAGSNAKNANKVSGATLNGYTRLYLADKRNALLGRPLNAVIVECQIGQKMKGIAGAAVCFFEAYFLGLSDAGKLDGPPTPVEYQTGSQKLRIRIEGTPPREVLPDDASSARKHRANKNYAIEQMWALLRGYPECRRWRMHFDSTDKKDDMSDAVLHAMWRLAVGSTRAPRGSPTELKGLPAGPPGSCDSWPPFGPKPRKFAVVAEAKAKAKATARSPTRQKATESPRSAPGWEEGRARKM